MSVTPPSCHDAEISDLCPCLIAIFGNYLISDRIFHSLPIFSVLQCSLASNFFKKISRNYLRRRKRLEINLEFGRVSQLTKLESMLMNCTDFPFVGSKLLLFHRYLLNGYPSDMDSERDLLCRQHQSERYDLLKMYPYVFQKLPVKTLRIDFARRVSTADFPYPDACFCEDVLKHLIITRASNTEYLEIIRWPIYQDLWQFLRVPQQSHGSADLDQSNIFRSLRTCNFRISGYEDLKEFKKCISQIAISSPFLENIYGPLHANIFFSSDDPGKYSNFQNRRYGNLSLPESKFHAIREIVCECRWMINLLLKIQPNLEVFGFNLQAITEVNTDKEDKGTAKIIVEKNLATIIENCKKSLTTLVCQDAVHMLSQVINVPLVNCVHLKLVLSASYKDFEDVLLFLKAIDFQKYLYNLRRVDLIFKYHFDYFGGPQKEIGNRSLIYKRAKYTCLSVKTLLLKYHGHEEFSKLIQPYWYAVAELFPNVKSLHVNDEQSVFSLEVGDPRWLANFQPVDIHVLGLPWNRTLEFASCYSFENLGKPCLILLTELLESIRDSTAEQLSGASRDEFNEWPYQPTRQLLWFKKRNCRILLRLGVLGHTICYKDKPEGLKRLGYRGYQEIFGVMDNATYRPRFDRIFSWVQAKLPEFSLVLEFKPCELGKLCNPIPFYKGRIQTDFEEDKSFVPLPRGFRTWLLNF